MYPLPMLSNVLAHRTPMEADKTYSSDNVTTMPEVCRPPFPRDVCLFGQRQKLCKYRHAVVTANSDQQEGAPYICLLYTSDAADERSSVDLGGRRIIKKKKN